MKGKRGQAAMEFLMTYGWAILVVLVAIGALAYFGVLNPGRFLPSSCTIGPGIGCDAHKVTSAGAGSTVQLLLRNGGGQDLTNAQVQIAGCTAEAAAQWIDGTVLGGADGVLLTSCSGVGAVGSRYKVALNITYTDASSIARTVVGDLTTKAE